MPALTSDRNTPQLLDPAPAPRTGAMGAAQLIYSGAIVMRNASGQLVKGVTATDLVGVGRSEGRFDNSSGAAGDLDATFAAGTFCYANSAGVDEITAADIDNVCYVVDDQTVAKSSDTDARSPAGIISDVDDQGVWVRFDAALTKAALS